MFTAVELVLCFIVSHVSATEEKRSWAAMTSSPSLQVSSRPWGFPSSAACGRPVEVSPPSPLGPSAQSFIQRLDNQFHADTQKCYGANERCRLVQVHLEKLEYFEKVLQFLLIVLESEIHIQYYMDSFHIEWNTWSLYCLQFWWLWHTNNEKPKLISIKFIRKKQVQFCFTSVR